MSKNEGAYVSELVMQVPSDLKEFTVMKSFAKQ